MKVWSPKASFRVGAGQIGLLTTLILKLKGLEVYTLARAAGPHLKSEIVEGLEANYVATSETSLADLAKKVGKADLIVDATGSSRLLLKQCKSWVTTECSFGPASLAEKRNRPFPLTRSISNGFLATSFSLGPSMRTASILNRGIEDLALGEVMYPNVIKKILTNPVAGLDNYKEMMRLLVEINPLSKSTSTLLRNNRSQIRHGSELASALHYATTHDKNKIAQAKGLCDFVCNSNHHPMFFIARLNGYRS